MKLAVVDTVVPFRRDVESTYAAALTDRLRRAGHAVEHVTLPFTVSGPALVADAMLAASLTRLDGIDRMIGLRFPAHLVAHDDKVIWQLRGRPRAQHGVGPGVEHHELADRAEMVCFASTRRLFAGTAALATTLEHDFGATPEVLRAPLLTGDAFCNEPAEQYIYAGGAIGASNRQSLLVKAMSHTRSGVGLVISGPVTSRAALADLLAAREASGCADRITVVSKTVDEDREASMINRSLAVASCPLHEDPFDHELLKGATAGKPLVTTSDSVGLARVLVDEHSGHRCRPDPAAIAKAFDALARSPRSCAALGAVANERVGAHGVSWERVLERLAG